MAILAAASPEDLSKFKTALSFPTDFDIIRQPETGLVMIRGRAGGTGAEFNLGEVTVTRCVVRISSGETGSSYCLGRHKQKALDAALFDALWQNPTHRSAVEEKVIAALKHKQDQAKADVAAETEATKVDFFTMVRGDN
ncbi:phosphonate C-P lyase system protein PhnG [Roseibium hamelinense]|nr:phosphonate C-P lyase system protein PhnG [Roseibium hamelinense]